MTFKKPSSKNVAGAFTLVELLSAVAIISILAILVFSGTSHAVARAHATTCIANLRAIGVGFAAFSADNNGFYPDGDRGGVWPIRISKYTNRKHFFCPVALEWEKDNVGYIRDLKKINDDDVWAANAIRISYGYNAGGLAPDVGHRWNPPNTDPRMIKVTNVTRPVVLLVDAGQLGANRDKGWGYYLAYPEKNKSAMPLPRHFDKANFLWTDGHIDQRFCDLKPNDSEPYKYTRAWDWEPRDEKLPVHLRP